MGMTEELLCTLATQCTGSPHIQWKDETLEGEEEKKETLIDFTPPYRRVHVWKELERCVGPLPSPENLDSTGLFVFIENKKDPNHSKKGCVLSGGRVF